MRGREIVRSVVGLAVAVLASEAVQAQCLGSQFVCYNNIFLSSDGTKSMSVPLYDSFTTGSSTQVIAEADFLVLPCRTVESEHSFGDVDFVVAVGFPTPAIEIPGEAGVAGHSAMGCGQYPVVTGAGAIRSAERARMLDA